MNVHVISMHMVPSQHNDLIHSTSFDWLLPLHTNAHAHNSTTHAQMNALKRSGQGASGPKSMRQSVTNANVNGNLPPNTAAATLGANRGPGQLDKGHREAHMLNSCTVHIE